MRPENLQDITTIISDGHDLRRRASVAISSVELSPIAANKTKLSAFFADCAGKATGTAGSGTTAVVADAGTQLVSSSAGVSYAVSGTYTVAANAVTSFRLPATAAVVASGVAIVKPVTGTFVTTITPTVAGGVITGFVLS